MLLFASSGGKKYLLKKFLTVREVFQFETKTIFVIIPPMRSKMHGHHIAWRDIVFCWNWFAAKSTNNRSSLWISIIYYQCVPARHVPAINDKDAGRFNFKFNYTSFLHILLHLGTLLPSQFAFYEAIYGYFDQVTVHLKVLLCPYPIAYWSLVRVFTWGNVQGVP